MATDIRFGYALSSEEHRPLDLVTNARRAEEAGFDFAMVSDHFHPWIDRQGQRAGSKSETLIRAGGAR